MADSMNMRDAAPTAPPTYFQAFKRNDFRLDEGYSEEMRSQAGSEMRAESRQGHVMDADSAAGTSTLILPEYFGNLNETERSGMCTIPGGCHGGVACRCPSDVR